MRPLVLLLHGFGADKSDMEGLIPFFRVALPELDYMALNAPFQCLGVPGGRQWFPIFFR